MVRPFGSEPAGQIAPDGANTDVTYLRAFSPEPRYATVVAGVLDAMTVLIDEALEMHERILGVTVQEGGPQAQ